MLSPYLLKQKRIGDISIYSESSSTINIYDFPKDYLLIGRQYIDKLNEYNYLVQGNKFFIIYFNRDQKHNEITFERENKLDQVAYGRQEVNVGVNPQIFNALSETDKSIYITKLIARILTQYYQRYSIDISKINAVEALILKYGGDMEVVYKVKETKKYKLIFSYQTKPHNEADAVIEYTDNSNSENNKKLYVHLRDFDDIDHLIQNTKVIDGEVVLSRKL